MSAVIIQKFSPEFLRPVEEIFFDSSTRKSFSSDEEMKAFQWKYLGSYLKQSPELALIAVQDDKVLGYVIGSEVSDFILQPHLKIFKAEIDKYPAHLHINCHSESRGLGVGSLLIKSLEIKLRERNIPGLHIMTGPDSQNRSFYRKLGFNFELVRDFEGRPILMMGKSLTGLVTDN